MLVLTRRRDEVLYIYTQNGDRIEIVVTYVDAGKVKLGINAPRSCDIRRKEIDNCNSKRELGL